jgi:putative salt-induced outer membrane protein
MSALIVVGSVFAPMPSRAGEPLPPAVAAMLDAAAANGEDTLQTVADIARKTNPNSIADIDAQVARWQVASKEAHNQKLKTQAFFQGITGQGEAGFNTSSGNTQSTGIVLGLSATKETLRWKHAFKGTVDYQRDDGIVSKERLFAGYEGSHNFSRQFYTLIVLNWERDAFAGYDSRFAQSLGLGFKVVDQPRLKIGFEGGPALRETQYHPGVSDTTLSWRSAGNMEWSITPSTIFTQTMSAFAEDQNTSLAATTALTTKVTGALSARGSFVVQHESAPPLDLRRTDTTTRFTLVYGF